MHNNLVGVPNKLFRVRKGSLLLFWENLVYTQTDRQTDIQINIAGSGNRMPFHCSS